VSRASVRQAITALAAKGLLVMRQGDGTYISDPGEEKGHVLEVFGRFLAKTQLDPEDILESRILVECEAARLCTTRATDEQLAKIKAIHLSKIDADPDESGENTQLNRELHYAIAEGAQNQVLLMFMEVLWNTMEDNMWPLLKKEAMTKYERKKSHDLQHEAIVSAICARDGGKAYEAMYTHLASIRVGIEKVMDKPNTAVQD
jgi:GntR family transcriptional repressor for pyruvate dehydrogenase complex